jgi:ribosomal protein L34
MSSRRRFATPAQSLEHEWSRSEGYTYNPSNTSGARSEGYTYNPSNTSGARSEGYTYNPSNTSGARSEGYTYAARVWALPLVQGSFHSLVAPCQDLQGCRAVKQF